MTSAQWEGADSLSESKANESDTVSSAINKLLEHPELISMVASALGAKDSDKENTPAQRQGTSSPTAQSDALSKIAQSDAISKIAQSDAISKIAQSDAISAIAPVLSALSLGGNIGKTEELRHARLLNALKPYLSESRAEAIDYFIRISQLSSLLGGIKKQEE